MSGVSGAWRKARPAKMTRPRRSPSRSRVKSASTRRATIEPVAGLEVARLHAAGDVERDHDVARLAPDLPHLVRHLRPGQRHDQEREPDQPERVRQPGPAAPARDRRAGQEREPRKADPLLGRAAGAGATGARRVARGHEQQQEEGGISEPHRASLLRAARRVVPAGAAAPAHPRGMRGRRRAAGPAAGELHQVRLVEQRRRTAAGARPRAARGGIDQSSSVRGPLPGRHALRRLEVVAQRVGHRLVVFGHLRRAPASRSRSISASRSSATAYGSGPPPARRRARPRVPGPRRPPAAGRRRRHASAASPSAASTRAR